MSQDKELTKLCVKSNRPGGAVEFEVLLKQWKRPSVMKREKYKKQLRRGKCQRDIWKDN